MKHRRLINISDAYDRFNRGVMLALRGIKADGQQAALERYVSAWNRHNSRILEVALADAAALSFTYTATFRGKASEVMPEAVQWKDGAVKGGIFCE